MVGNPVAMKCFGEDSASFAELTTCIALITRRPRFQPPRPSSTLPKRHIPIGTNASNCDRTGQALRKNIRDGSRPGLIFRDTPRLRNIGERRAGAHVPRIDRYG